MLSEAGTVKSRGVVVKHAGLWSLRRRFESARDYLGEKFPTSSLSPSKYSVGSLTHNLFFPKPKLFKGGNKIVGVETTAVTEGVLALVFREVSGKGIGSS